MKQAESVRGLGFCISIPPHTPAACCYLKLKLKIRYGKKMRFEKYDNKMTIENLYCRIKKPEEK
jgi:hypothetical protein